MASVQTMQDAHRHSRKDRIRKAFSAAIDYDRHAVVQRRAAQQLADRIAALPLPRNARICEVGCGTGFLGLALGPRLPRATWLATDLSSDMIGRAREVLGGDPRFDFAVVDAEHPAPLAELAPFDVICSNFAAQWFSELDGVLSKLSQLLKPGGRLLMTTLADGTFAEWLQAHTDLGLAAGAAAYPTLEALRGMGAADMTVEVYEDVETFATGREFLTALRAIGATTPLQDHVALRPGDLRRVLRRFEELGCKSTYRVAVLQLSLQAGLEERPAAM